MKRKHGLAIVDTYENDRGQIIEQTEFPEYRFIDGVPYEILNPEINSWVKVDLEDLPASQTPETGISTPAILIAGSLLFALYWASNR